MEQQFSLSWNNFHGILSDGFAGLLGKGEFVDVTLAVEGHLLQAHQVILSICSPYFKKIFQTNPCQHPIVFLKDVTHKAMKDLIQFMYNGEVSVKREDLTTFIGIAEALQIKGLTNNEADDNYKELVQQCDLKTQVDLLNSESRVSENLESGDVSRNNTSELLNQHQYMEKIQKFNSLKRKSEEFLQNYYSNLINTEKRTKVKEPTLFERNNKFYHIENTNNYEGHPGNLTSNYIDPQRSSDLNKETTDKHEDSNAIDLKSECDETDLVIDTSACSTPKDYDVSQGHEDRQMPLTFHSSQTNCTGLSSLFMDLKSLTNGKVPNETFTSNTYEEFPKITREHRLITIPQKEDGKKKYPQRSCKICWKLGKRRDTRFICNSCDLPFCKTPCFGIHYNEMLKAAQICGEYYVP